MAFLPTSREEMLEQGFEQVDFVYVLGDAYVDHPSFGCAIITRTLQAFGYSCAIPVSYTHLTLPTNSRV